MTKEHKRDEDTEKAGSTKSLYDQLNIEPQPTDAELLTHPSYLELQRKLNETEQLYNEANDKMLRIQAEAENMRRRSEQSIEKAHKYALEKFIPELLPVIDSLERSLQIPGCDEAMIDGINMTLKLFNTALEKNGVSQIDPLSQPFNPEFHQAVSTVADNNVRPNTVVNVLQKGYLLNNRLIRPALVVVAKADVENS